MGNRPELTWRHGLGFIAAAAVCYWIASGHWFGRVSSLNMVLGYGLAAAFAFIGIYTILEDRKLL
jgi:hypothetical protein